MEKELARYVKMKYKLTEAEIDALTDEEYDALCDDVLEQIWRTEDDLQKLNKILGNEQDFIDFLMIHRP